MIEFRTNPPKPKPVQSCVRSLEERMAEDVREMAFAGQNVSVETLVREKGWTSQTVKRLLPSAVAIARRLSTRQIAEA